MGDEAFELLRSQVDFNFQMVDESEELDENDCSDDESEVSSSYVANEEKDVME